jgi:predicted nucleic acid-binding protein
VAAKNIRELGSELGKMATETGTEFGKVSSERAAEIAKRAGEEASRLRKKGLSAIRKLTTSPEVNLALLAELATLRERRVITEEEFQSKKKEILDRV